MVCPKCRDPSCRNRGFIYIDNDSTGLWECDQLLIKALKSRATTTQILELIPRIQAGIGDVHAIDLEAWERWIKLTNQLFDLYQELK